MYGKAYQLQDQRAQSEETLLTEGEPQIDLRATLRVLRRHRWLIVTTIVLIVATAALITLQLRQQFTATTLVVVDSRDSQMLGFEPGISDGSGLVDTEVEIARSSKVLERAGQALDIGHSREFAQSRSVVDMAKALVGIGASAPHSVPGRFVDLPETERARLIDAFAKTVNVHRIGLTSIISISATAFDPETAAKTANALSDAYLTEQIASKAGSNERAATFLRARVDGLAQDISSLETQIDNFVSTKLATLGSPEAKTLLIELDQEARTRKTSNEALKEIQAAIQTSDFAQLANLLAVRDENFASRRATLQAAIAAASDSVRLAEAKKSLDALDDEIRAAAQKKASGLQTDIALSNARSAEARNQIADSLTQTELPKEISVELFRLQRDAETSRTLYQSYLTKLRQVEQQTDFTIPDSRVIAAATPPSHPSFPPRALIFGGSILFALGLGIGLAFLRENFIGGVTSEEQLESLVGIQVVAGVPVYRGSESMTRPDQAVVAQPLSGFAEAIRRIRLGVEMLVPGTKQCVFVTSTLPGDGKTTIALALARQFALTGTSTLLIDGDLRHPNIHHLLGETTDGGLTRFLTHTGSCAFDQVSLTKEPETGLNFVLGSEASAVATDALLMSSRFADLMRFARQQFDIVIVDTPPIGLVVDASIVARHCDIGVYVVRYASTGQQAIRGGLRELTRRTDLLICGVLNQVAEAEGSRYGNKRRYRSYYR
jgi:capsular exopolysaccharide synthesis family protein